MTHLEQHDGFDLVRAAIQGCSPDGCGARAQKQRYRAITPFITNVRQAEADTMIFSSRGRRIGPIGTVIRVLAGLALLTLAYLNKPAGLVGGLQLHDLLLGLIALPAASIAVGLLARRFVDGPLRFSGAMGMAVNLGVLAALFAVHYTAGAAALFYGATLLVAAWLGEAGCEFTVLSNACLRRNDEIGCPVLTPIDALELRHRQGRTTLSCRAK